MRVISGTAKGRKLIAPSGMKTRPTGDRMKEDLFNILGSKVFNSSFLDLFCGSGSVGIEALSRGASCSTFVDRSREAISATKKNLCNTHMEENSVIFSGNASDFLANVADKTYDIIFMDPPYENSLMVVPVLDHIKNGKLLADDGIVIIECPVDTELLAIVDSTDIKNLNDLVAMADLSVIRKKKYSNMQFIFLKRSKDIDGNISR